MDVFDFDNVLESGITSTTRDVITDFTIGTVTAHVERIDLSDIDANASTATNDAFRFIGSAAFSTTNTSGQLRVSYASGNAILYGSTDADSGAEFSIQLNGIQSLRAIDFIL